jgi:hypothetical protein
MSCDDLQVQNHMQIYMWLRSQLLPTDRDALRTSALQIESHIVTEI